MKALFSWLTRQEFRPTLTKCGTPALRARAKLKSVDAHPQKPGQTSRVARPWPGLPALTPSQRS